MFDFLIQCSIQKKQEEVREASQSLRKAEEKYKEYETVKRRLNGSHTTLEGYREGGRRRFDGMGEKLEHVRFAQALSEDMTEYFTGVKAQAAHRRIDGAIQSVRGRMELVSKIIAQLKAKIDTLNREIGALLEKASAQAE